MNLNISNKALLFFEKNKYSNLMKEEWKYTNINKFQSIKYQQNTSHSNDLKRIKSKANKILINNLLWCCCIITRPLHSHHGSPAIFQSELNKLQSFQSSGSIN